MSKGAIGFFRAQFRPSTSRLYQQLWDKWARWYKDKGGRDPLKPRTADLANYLAHLAQAHSLSAASLKTHRSAIASVLATRGSRALASDPLITGVLKGIANSQTRKRQFLPKWDLAVVLNYLKGPKFKDNKLLDHELLTYKTAFLTALASGRRASEISNLSGIKGDFILSPGRSLELKFLPDFLAKNQNPADPSPSITIPPLLKQASKDKQDIALCPVRALIEYRSRSEAYRSPSQRALFISVNKGHSTDITRATMSRWLKTLIRKAYMDLHQDGKLKPSTQIPSDKFRAHEIRAWATTMASKSTSLVEVMRAAYWRSSTVFTRHYLRDVAMRSEDGSLRLPAMVAAQCRLSAAR